MATADLALGGHLEALLGARVRLHLRHGGGLVKQNWSWVSGNRVSDFHTDTRDPTPGASAAAHALAVPRHRVRPIRLPPVAAAAARHPVAAAVACVDRVVPGPALQVVGAGAAGERIAAA